MATRTSTLETDRAGLPQTVHYFVQLFFRYFIAYQMFSYSSAKLLGTQFTISPSTLDRPIGDLSGFELTWAYYGYSYTYGLFIAGAQITAGVLLLFRRTVRLGLLLFLTVIGNIVMIDFFYNIDGAKSMAVTLLLMGLYLFVSDGRAFWSYLFGTPYVKEATIPGFVRRRGWTTWVRAAAIPVLFVGAFGSIYLLKQQFMPSTPLNGAWNFAGDRAATRLYFDEAGFCAVRMANSSTYYGECPADAQNQTVSLDIKQIDVDKLLAEGLIDETTDEATFERLTADSPTAFKFTGTYQLTDEDTLVLEPQGGGEPVTLERAQYAYGNPYRDPFANLP